MVYKLLPEGEDIHLKKVKNARTSAFLKDTIFFKIRYLMMIYVLTPFSVFHTLVDEISRINILVFNTSFTAPILEYMALICLIPPKTRALFTDAYLPH